MLISSIYNLPKNLYLYKNFNFRMTMIDLISEDYRYYRILNYKRFSTKIEREGCSGSGQFCIIDAKYSYYYRIFIEAVSVVSSKRVSRQIKIPLEKLSYVNN